MAGKNFGYIFISYVLTIIMQNKLGYILYIPVAWNVRILFSKGFRWAGEHTSRIFFA